ncbi:metal ABC transporter permease [Desulfatibacillum aliphaticivorans]|uniref:ABC-3 protein n=1 Tax=Desulfatibacillum aliphaticivorans TaxID=218208 RepID=B8FAZ2_DESAL|nr:metal ABC transporter permease [Desulfatibacillum aliphaticivorans]ACL04078.1 ABC-3 protein [Desulfatibacillum aliphaticivorans]
MIEFIQALMNPDNVFLRLAFIVGGLASVPFGIMGAYVVTRRISYLAGAISHCVFGGIGLGLYLQNKVGLQWFDPMYGAVGAALLAAVIIGAVSLYAKQREDTVIGALWAVGMASGLLFVDITPGYFDISSYLFGDILLISTQDVWMVLGLNVLVVGLSLWFYNRLLAVCFDEEFSALRGIPVGAVYMLLLCLTALTVVLLVRVVGIVMVIALLTIPAAVASQFAKRLWQTMVMAVFFCLAFTWTGLGVSYHFSLSSGPTIIVIAGLTYLAVVSGARFVGKRS